MYILSVRGHYEVYSTEGNFLFSADTQREAMQEHEARENGTIV